MFKERLIVAAKNVGMVIGYPAAAIACIAFIFGIGNWLPNKVVDTMLNWTLYIMIGIIGLIFTIGILTWIWTYIEWQFIEPYKESKNRRKKDNGEYH